MDNGYMHIQQDYDEDEYEDQDGDEIRDAVPGPLPNSPSWNNDYENGDHHHHDEIERDFNEEEDKEVYCDEEIEVVQEDPNDDDQDEGNDIDLKELTGQPILGEYEDEGENEGGEIDEGENDLEVDPEQEMIEQGGQYLFQYDDDQVGEEGEEDLEGAEPGQENPEGENSQGDHHHDEQEYYTNEEGYGLHEPY